MHNECFELVSDQNSLGNLRIYFCTFALQKRIKVKLEKAKYNNFQALLP